jgi:hypothetical protein
MEGTMNMLFVKMVEKLTHKLCGGCFILGRFPIINISNLDNCFVINTQCLPFWKREADILINVTPFLPFDDMTVVRIMAYDGSQYNIQDIYGNTCNSESLKIELAYWDKRKNRYVLQNLHYLPDTKKTFSACLGGYPNTEAELSELPTDAASRRSMGFCNLAFDG